MDALHNLRMTHGDRIYVWQATDWPNWRYDLAALAQALAHVSRSQGLLLGRLADVGMALRDQASLSALTEDVVKTSEIEGEHLNVASVRSFHRAPSGRRHRGTSAMPAAARARSFHRAPSGRRHRGTRCGGSQCRGRGRHGARRQRKLQSAADPRPLVRMARSVFTACRRRSSASATSITTCSNEPGRYRLMSPTGWPGSSRRFNALSIRRNTRSMPCWSRRASGIDGPPYRSTNVR